MADQVDGEPESSARESAETFSLLGDETRLAILTTLHDDAVETPAAFSTLSDRVGADDSSGFNYHLRKLRPHFVTKSRAGYALTAAGRRLARAVVAGRYTDALRLEPFETDGACYACGERSLVAAYEDERFTVDCRACDSVVLRVHVPPTVFRGRDPADALAAFEEWSVFQVEQAKAGVCPDCGGPVDRSRNELDVDHIAVRVAPTFDCQGCGRHVVTSFGALASLNPAVREFHRRTGDPLAEMRLWEVPQFVTDEHVEVHDAVPWRAVVSFEADGETCEVAFDADLSVVRVEISERGADPSARSEE